MTHKAAPADVFEKGFAEDVDGGEERALDNISRAVTRRHQANTCTHPSVSAARCGSSSLSLLFSPSGDSGVREAEAKAIN
jgi:hypothetical protein